MAGHSSYILLCLLIAPSLLQGSSQVFETSFNTNPILRLLNTDVLDYMSFTYTSNKEMWKPNLVIVSALDLANFESSRLKWGSLPPSPVPTTHFPTTDTYHLDLGRGITAPHPSNHHLGHYAIQVIEVRARTVEKVLKFCAKLVLFGSPHRDHFIFIGPLDALKQVFSSREARDLKFKLALDVNTKQRYREPYVYDGSPLHPVTSFPLLADRHVNIVGRRVDVAAGRIPPFITFDQRGEGNGGNIFKFLCYVSIQYNVTMVMDYSARRTGVYTKGHWTGLTGMLHYRRADLAIPMGNIPQRFAILDFLQTHTSGIFFVTRQPQSHIKWQAIVYPLAPSCWAAFFVTYATVSVTLYVILRVSKEKNPIYQTLFIPYQITISQGFNIKVPASAKTLAAFWMFFILVIVTGYTSDLVSYFSFPEPEIIPRDFESLDKRKDYKVVFHNDKGTALQYFGGSPPGAVRRVFERFEMEDDVAKCVQQALLGKKTVCVDWDLKIRSADAGNLTLPRVFVSMLVESKPAVILPLGIVFPKNSIYTGTYDFVGKYYRDMGMVDKTTRDVFYNYSVAGKAYMKTQTHTILYNRIKEKWDHSQMLVRRFSLENVTACFASLVIFLILSTIAFFGERAYFQAQRRGAHLEDLAKQRDSAESFENHRFL